MGTCHAPGNVARFRCTEKLRKELGITLHDGMAPDVLPLGDWYCTLFFVDRRKCLLFTSSTTLFSVLVPGVRRADLANLGGLFRSEARRALSDAGCPPEAIAEWLVGPPDEIGKTVDRRVLGSMNDYLSMIAVSRSRAESIPSICLGWIQPWSG